MSNFSRIEPIIRNYASIPVALLCLAALGFFTKIGYRAILGPVLGATVGGIVAVVILHLRPLRTHKSEKSAPPDYRIPVIISSLFVVSTIVMYRLTSYGRPWIHYFVFGTFAGYIAYEIATGTRKRRVLPQLLVLAFFTYWSVQLAYPAGMFAADTRGDYIPLLRSAVEAGHLSSTMPAFGHLIYVLEAVQVTGMSAQLGYFLLATLVLTGTVLVISMLDRVLPAIDTREALFGALLFGCMSWTLGRGFHPNKLNFFYALTLLVGFVPLIGYVRSTATERRRWLLIGVFVAPALIYGHRFSSGAAMVFLGTIAVFALGYQFIQKRQNYEPRYPAVFAIAYVIAILGNPVGQGTILGRGVSILSSIFAPAATGGGGGGPGRYSELSLELLLLSTGGQAILFGLGVVGAAVAIRRSEWEYDLGIVWMGTLVGLLFVSMLFNTTDVQPQRFYALLGLFGLNIFAGVALVYFKQSTSNFLSARTIGVIVFVFAVLSLGSPVAGMHLSFVGDEVPHIRLHNTNQQVAGDEWVNKYQGNESSMLTMGELPIELVADKTATIDISRLEPRDRYMYTQATAESGMISRSSGRGIGARQFVFLEFEPPSSEAVIYANGDTAIYLHQTIGQATGDGDQSESQTSKSVRAARLE